MDIRSFYLISKLNLKIKLLFKFKQIYFKVHSNKLILNLTFKK